MTSSCHMMMKQGYCSIGIGRLRDWGCLPVESEVAVVDYAVDG